MKTVAIVQARMGSSRLPGKTLADIAGKPALLWTLDRLSRSERIDEILVATTMHREDDVIAQFLKDRTPVYRGAESDVLRRYLDAALSIKSDIIVRITADCPLIDPGIVDRAIRMLDDRTDFVSNSVERTFPRGLDVEVMHMDVLERVARMAHSPNAREHVTYHIYGEAPEHFVIKHLKDPEDNSSLSWTLDTADDLIHLRRICDDVDYRELIERCLKNA